MAKIIPTILTDKEEEYHDRVLLAEHVSDLIQIDVIDGKFANTTTVGVETIAKYLTSSNLEIQLMVIYPQNYIDELVKCQHVSRIIVPFEIDADINQAIYHIKNHQKQAGLSLNPNTPVNAALHFFDDIDLLLLLAVEPGFSGQTFQEHVIDKVKEAKRLTGGLAVEVDGGINFDNAPKLARVGTDFLAANSVLYKADDFYLAYEKLAKLASLTTDI